MTKKEDEPKEETPQSPTPYDPHFPAGIDDCGPRIPGTHKDFDDALDPSPTSK